MSREIKEFINELKELWALWSAIMLLINYLGFISKLNPNAPDYIFQILAWLIINQVESLVLATFTKVALEFLRHLGLPL